jgi:hypothetical protein
MQVFYYWACIGLVQYQVFYQPINLTACNKVVCFVLNFQIFNNLYLDDHDII